MCAPERAAVERPCAGRGRRHARRAGRRASRGCGSRRSTAAPRWSGRGSLPAYVPGDSVRRRRQSLDPQGVGGGQRCQRPAYRYRPADGHSDPAPSSQACRPTTRIASRPAVGVSTRAGRLDGSAYRRAHVRVGGRHQQRHRSGGAARRHPPPREPARRDAGAPGGPELLELVEEVRRRSRGDDADGAADAGGLAALLEDVDLDTAARLVRAFGTYFHLANVTEQVHRAREMRAERAGKGGWLAQTAERIRAAGLPPEDIAALVDRLAVRPVFTAHPTEAARRSILSKRRRVADLLDAVDDPPGRPADRRGHRPALADRRAAPGPARADRRGAQRGVLPRRADAAHGRRRARGAGRPAGRARGRPADGAPAPLRFGSWIGGDRDGNPNVTPRVTHDVLVLQHGHAHARPHDPGRRPHGGPVDLRAAGRRERRAAGQHRARPRCAARPARAGTPDQRRRALPAEGAVHAAQAGAHPRPDRRGRRAPAGPRLPRLRRAARRPRG